MAILISGVNALYGFSGNHRFTHLTVKEGLSNSTVYSILQDNEGFMWFGTPNGLNKFDGYRFTSYKNIPGDSTSLSSDNAGNIYKDHRGIIWVGQWGGGLDAFDPVTLTARHYLHDPENPNTISDNRVQTLFEDSVGDLWLGTFSGGLNKLDKNRENITVIKNNPQDDNSLSDNRVWAITEDINHNLWIATSSGLNRLNLKTKKFDRFYHDPENTNSLNHNATRALLFSNDSTLWVGTIEGFNRININTLKIDRFLYKQSADYRFNDNSVNAFLLDKENKIWVCTAKGIIIINPQTDESYRFTYRLDDDESLSDNEVRSIYQDSSGIIWIGTKHKGLNKYNPASKKFTNLVTKKNEKFRLKSEDVQVVSGVSYQGGQLLLFSNVYGFYIYSLNAGHIKFFPAKTIDREDKRGLYFRSIFLSEEDTNIVWIGAQQKIFRFNLATHTFTPFSLPKSQADRTNLSAVTDLVEVGGKIWLGRSLGGIAEYDLSRGKISKHFIHREGDSTSISHNEVYFLKRDGKSGLWVGTGNGLNYFDLRTHTFRHIKFKKELPHDRRFFSIYQKNKNELWLGAEDGLIRYNPINGTYHIFKVNDGLPDNKISSIIGDKKGMLWLGTDNGLSRYDPKSGSFSNFDYSDGLLNSEYIPGAYFMDERGTCYFGGKLGLDYFNPDDISVSNFQPPIVFTDFQLINKSILPKRNSILGKTINNTSHITIPYSYYVFSLEFAALDFAKPEKIKYAYKLEGADKEWFYTNADRRFATYSNVKGGTYTFKVKSTNGDGVWGRKIREIKVTIVPPFWETLWFRLLSILFVGTLILLVFRLRLKAVKSRNKTLKEVNDKLSIEIEQRIKAEKEKELMQEQLMQNHKMEAVGVLAGGIAHDFNNLLTAILGNLELSQMYIDAKNEASKMLESAKKAVLRARGLTQQLLTFSKGGEPIKATASLEEVVRESANFVLTGTNVNTQFKADENLWLVDIDKGQISQVVQNLVINAKEALSDGGTISIEMSNIVNGSIHTLPISGKNYVLLKIKDTGEGIKDEDLKNIFNPYFTTKKTGNGLGLAVSYSVISKHDGYISVESNPGKGTLFNVYLPASEKPVADHKNPEMYHGRGQGRILVMDDEEPIREILNTMLTKLGYDVQESCNVDEVVSIYKEAMDAAHPFDLVIMDLTIPGGSGGKEAVKLLLEMDPSVTAYVSSGYSNDPVMANYMEYGFKGVIKKPFTLKDVKKLLHDAIPIK